MCFHFGGKGKGGGGEFVHAIERVLRVLNTSAAYFIGIFQKPISSL